MKADRTEMHLTRQQARELPSTIEAPHFDPAGGILLASDLRLPIFRDGRMVTDFVPGWHPDAISLLFYPTILLQFRHVDGDAACWLLDSGLNYVASAIADLPSRSRRDCERRIASIATFLAGCGGASMPCRTPDDVTSFLKLADGIKLNILHGSGHIFPSEVHARRFGPEDASHDVGFALNIETDAQGQQHFAGEGRSHELLARGERFTLQPGWHMPRLSSLFFPVYVADLEHEDGRTACWFFDRHGNFITDGCDRLPEPARSIVASRAATILEDVWQDVIAHPGDRTRDHVEGFLALPATTRHALFDLHHSLPDHSRATSTWILAEPQPDAMAHVAQTERGAVLLDAAYVRQALARSMQSQNAILVNEDAFTWPSPIDGTELGSSGFALMLSTLCFAYRVQDLERGFTFYMIGFSPHFRVFALYLPENDLLIAGDGHTLQEALQCRGESYRRDFMRHAIHLGAAILAGAKKPPGEIIHCFRGREAMHIGHHLWQDLSGIHALLADVKPDRVPSFLVPDNHLRPEIYGPIDSIFPGLHGKIIRKDEGFLAMVPQIYEKHARVIKATSIHVPRAVGSAILASYKASPGYRKLVARRGKVRAQSDVIVLIGLRAGNRTMVDMEFFATRIIDALSDAFPKLTIIVDGQNAGSDPVFGSYGDNPDASDSFLRQELDIADALSRHAAAARVTLVNNIGRPMMDSLLWCDCADFFIAPWGAALAKYRWVCNKPGLVLAGRWNLLNRADLPIYHSHECNEDPAPIWFNDPETAEDVQIADGTAVSSVERGNFRLDGVAVAKQMVDLVNDHCGRRSLCG